MLAIHFTPHQIGFWSVDCGGGTLGLMLECGEGTLGLLEFIRRHQETLLTSI